MWRWKRNFLVEFNSAKEIQRSSKLLKAVFNITKELMAQKLLIKEETL